MGRRLQRDGWAELVFQHIPSTKDDQWISGVELEAITGLTRAQVRAGVAYLRDQFPDDPLVSSPDGYRFTNEEEHVLRYRKTRMRSAQTTTRRLKRGVMEPWLAQLDDRRMAKLVNRQFERLLEDMAEVI